jgi:hypothetical protein
MRALKLLALLLLLVAAPALDVAQSSSSPTRCC